MINLINFMFINFVFIIVVLGTLINKLEPLLPVIIRQTFRYGKHSYKGSQNKLIAKLEVPKSWFKHFYSFAIAWTCFGVCTALVTYQMKATAPELLLTFLDFVAGGKERRVEVDSMSCMVASLLLFLQCSRRYYETHYIQIFSSKSKMNFSHYMVGYLHYFGCMIAILANAEGFVRGSRGALLSIRELPLYKLGSCFLFLYSWYYQYASNLVFVNLRKDKSGNVSTEKHLLPRGGYFQYVSSPHMLFEILMYVALLGVMPSCVTWRWIVAWVISNQTANAVLTHKWYCSTFSDYPKNRKAIYPGLL